MQWTVNFFSNPILFHLVQIIRKTVLGLADAYVSRDNSSHFRRFCYKIWQEIFGMQGNCHYSWRVLGCKDLPHSSGTFWIGMSVGAWLENNWWYDATDSKAWLNSGNRSQSNSCLSIWPKNSWKHGSWQLMRWAAAPCIDQSRIVRDIILASSRLLNGISGGTSVKTLSARRTLVRCNLGLGANLIYI